MAKLAYLECPTGIAGDMCLGAIVDAGVPLAYLTEQLARLGLAAEYQLEAKRVHRNGQQATKVDVHLQDVDSDTDLHTADPHTASHSDAHHKHSSNTAHAHHDSYPANPETHVHNTRHLPEIEHLITAAQLPSRATNWSLAVFRQLAQAEGAVHGIPPHQVHFHEVGAIDAIVDIVGTCLGFDWLDIDQLYCSALPTGGGVVRAAHGLLPVPAPAVLKLWELRQVPIYSNGIQRELVTPTGAAIVTTLAIRFGDPPAMTLQKVGLGAGSRDLAIPNLLRLWLGEGEMARPASVETVQKTQPAPQQEPIALLETQIDDSSPQAIGYLYETLFAAGAVDVFTQAIGMKKSRPGILLSVVCHPQQVKACEAVLFRETTTLGIRHSLQTRSILQRQFETITTAHGAVRIKIARFAAAGSIVNVQPEYEDCAAIARQTRQPWREVHRLALQQWYEQSIDVAD